MFRCYWIRYNYVVLFCTKITFLWDLHARGLSLAILFLRLWRKKAIAKRNQSASRQRESNATKRRFRICIRGTPPVCLHFGPEKVIFHISTVWEGRIHGTHCSSLLFIHHKGGAPILPLITLDSTILLAYFRCTWVCAANGRFLCGCRHANRLLAVRPAARLLYGWIGTKNEECLSPKNRHRYSRERAPTNFVELIIVWTRSRFAYKYLALSSGWASIKTCHSCTDNRPRHTGQLSTPRVEGGNFCSYHQIRFRWGRALALNR